MLEAFDLLPVVDCLKLDNMDAVQVCMDKLEPWMEITEGGNFEFSLNAVNGFIGGSVGVIGTVIAAQVKKGEVKERLKCVYCDGTGQILCGHCLGTRVVSFTNDDGALMLGEDCDTCEKTGSVVCINCQGSGLSVPEEFLQVLGDEDVGFTEADYIGLFDEARIPRETTPSSPLEKLTAPQSAATPVAAGSGDGSDDVKRPTDYTGGMG